MASLLLIAFVFLIAGVIAVPLATRFGLGSVLGYLIAGIVLSPFLRSFGVDVVSLQHFAEFGVVMMLFLIGLELEPKVLWQMRARLLGLGGLQVGLTTAAVTALCMVLGLQWSVALAVGLVLSLSSTAIVLQTLGEKGLMRSDGGQASFQILLFQDIAVIPMLALIPLLALPELADSVTAVSEHASDAAHGADGAHHGGDDHGGDIDLVSGLPGWLRAIVTLGAIAFVVVGGAYLTRPIFRFVATARLRELFTATALMIVIGIALLMTLVGLSPALGTFLAGVVLANSEYRHELESDIEPFKGLLLGLFFITVGAGIDFGLLFSNLGLVLGATLALMTIKALVLLLISVIFKVPGADRWLFGLGLAQAGEFGFVLLSFTVANNVIPPDLASTLLLVVALSMLLTPALFILYDRVIAPRFVQSHSRAPDDITGSGPVIIAGHGRFGGVVNRIMSSAGVRTVVLDHSSAQLEMLRAFGVEVFYGDATRPDLLHAAGIEDASLLVIAIDDRAQATELVKHVTHNHPDVHIVVRALDRTHVYDLYAAGARDIVRETFDSSVRAGRSALEALGFHPYDAERRTRRFTQRDRHILAEVAEFYDPDIPLSQNTAYIERAKILNQELERELQTNVTAVEMRNQRGWLPPDLGDVAAEEAAARNKTATE